MPDEPEQEYSDTLKDEEDSKSSARVLAALKKAERSFNGYQGLCDTIDDVYTKEQDRVATATDQWIDPEYDLFWSSVEILKPALYAHPPQPVVAPKFKDSRPLQNTTAELLERVSIASFDDGGIDEAMCQIRDDLILYNRGVMWLTLEEEDGKKCILYEQIDRKDFLHPPQRKWSDVPWAARRAWMTMDEMEDRFREHSGDLYQMASLAPAGENSNDGFEGGEDNSRKAGVWEVWHKADNRVYWVVDGCDEFLDQGEPHLKLRGFFPCPRPAYGTRRPRTLLPVPDYVRYEAHFRKVNVLTRRIYTLLDQVKLKVLLPVGGQIGDAVEQAVRESDDTVFITVPASALSGAGSSNLMVHLPLEQVAAAITGLIEARRELFSDFDRLSGISDIMRGETEADETLGAQRLKGQYGSVRVKDRVGELQRVARDATIIGAEIASEHFSQQQLLDMSQMEIPTRADIRKAVADIKSDAEEEMKALRQAVKQAQMAQQQGGQQMVPQGQPQPPQGGQQQAPDPEQMFQEGKQQIVSKYAPMLKEAGEQVPIESVVELLRDEKAMGFAFEIATDSTIMTDEMQEKASRNEFLTVFSSATTGLVQLASLGAPAAALAGEVLKFVLAPYRVSRELHSVIDKFIEAAPQMAAQQQGQGQGNSEAEAAIAQANLKLAEAEIQKAGAAMAKVQADTQAKQQEIQFRAAEAAAKAQADQKRLMLEMADTRGGIAETEAKIKKIYAEIQLAQQRLGLEAHKEQREDFKVASDVQLRRTDQQIGVQQSEREAAFKGAENQRADRDQQFNQRVGAKAEQRADMGEQRADRAEDRADRELSINARNGGG